MIDRDLAFFPGCALDGAGREYGRSTLAVLEALDRPVRVLDDWNCCGATAARNTDPELSVRLCARNLALAAQQDRDLLVNCAACYNNLAHCRQYLMEHPEVRPPDAGESSAAPESANVQHLLTLLTTEELMERLRGRLSRPLGDMRLACYYGCLLVRPGGYTHVDDPENPTRMDELMRLCGAETIDWSYKTDCCGGSFSLTREDTAVDLMARIFAAAADQGATGLVTACPLCQMNLDAWQRQVGKVLGRDVSMPVYYFTELLALAMDLPGVQEWLAGHMTGARAAARECR